VFVPCVRLSGRGRRQGPVPRCRHWHIHHAHSERRSTRSLQGILWCPETTCAHKNARDQQAPLDPHTTLVYEHDLEHNDLYVHSPTATSREAPLLSVEGSLINTTFSLCNQGRQSKNHDAGSAYVGKLQCAIHTIIIGALDHLLTQ